VVLEVKKPGRHALRVRAEAPGYADTVSVEADAEEPLRRVSRVHAALLMDGEEFFHGGEGTLLAGGERFDAERPFSTGCDPAAGVRLRYRGADRLAFRCVTSWLDPWGSAPPQSGGLELELRMPRESIRGEPCRVEFVLRNRLDREVENPMLHAGLPGGAKVLESSLDALVAEGIVHRCEVRSDGVVFYLKNIRGKEERRGSFLVAGEFSGRFAGRTSQAYEYYTPEVRAEHPPCPMAVRRVP
jgi:hypothetical protein